MAILLLASLSPAKDLKIQFDVNNPMEAAIDYIVYVSSDGGGTFKRVGSIRHSDVFVIPNLGPGTYHVRVTASDGDTETGPSNVAIATVPQPPNAPGNASVVVE